jgi:hypothetical protein
MRPISEEIEPISALRLGTSFSTVAFTSLHKVATKCCTGSFREYTVLPLPDFW